jgi:hypothetical protein
MGLSMTFRVARQASLFAQLAKSRAELDLRLTSQLSMITAKMSTQNSEIHKGVNSRFDNATKHLAAIIATQEPAITFIKSTTECTKDGLVLNPAGDACTAPDPGDYGHFGKVHHNGFENDDGR